MARALTAIARAEILPRFTRLEACEVRSKTGPHDLVTVVDEAVEREIGATLRPLFPGVPVVGEEAASVDPGLLARIGSADLVFVCDPLDGTANFAAGLPLFGTMLALIRRGEPVAAWIHDPIRRDTAIALRGEGAWVEDEDGRQQALRAASAVPLACMAAVIAHRMLPAEHAASVRPRLGLFGAGWELRCAAQEWRLGASGRVHVLFYWRLLPWDHAPGSLLFAEAGGFVRRLDGLPYHAGVHSGGLLAAPDRDSWESVRAALFEH